LQPVNVACLPMSDALSMQAVRSPSMSGRSIGLRPAMASRFWLTRG
jgi:hypothetical protein